MDEPSTIDVDPQGSPDPPGVIWRTRRDNLVLLLVSVGLAVAAQVMLKSGMNHIGIIHNLGASSLVDAAARAIVEPRVWGGLTLFVVSGAVWLIILSRVPLSLAYPFVGLGYIVIVALSRFALHERVSPVRWTGAVLVASGVILIGISAVVTPRSSS